MAGRPTKLTPEVTASIVADLEAGHYIETAAESAGVHVTTLYRWMADGAKGIEPYAAFHEAVTRAKADGEKDLVATVKAGDGPGVGFGQAKAAAFLLERTRPHKFAARVNVKIEDAVGKVLDVVGRVCSPEDFARVLEGLERLDSEAGEVAPSSDSSHESEPVH